MLTIKARIILDTQISPACWSMIQNEFINLLGTGTEISPEIGEIYNNRDCNHACLETVSLMPFAKRVMEVGGLKRLPVRIWCSCCGERERVFRLVKRL